MTHEAAMRNEDRPETYWDGRGQGTIEGCTRALSSVPPQPEALPPHEDGEVEIVLIKMRSTTGDLISLRARRDSDAIAYRMVDEYELEQVVIPPQSSQPLSFGELTELLWTFQWEECEGPEFVGFWEYQYEEDSEDFDSIREFFVIDSDFYNGLNEWLEGQFDQWKEALS